MKIKKIKKLLRDPKAFIRDSKYIKIMHKKNKNDIGFIVISENHELAIKSINSISAANKFASTSSPYVSIITHDIQLIAKSIKKAVSNIGSTYVKLLVDGDEIKKDFIFNFINYDAGLSTHEIIQHSYTNASGANTIDNLILNIKGSSSANGVDNKEYLLPLLSCLIFKSDLLLRTKVLSLYDSQSSEITNVLKIFNECDGLERALFIDNIFCYNSSLIKLEEKFAKITKDSNAFICFLSQIESIKINEKSAFLKKTIIYAMHNLFLIILRNKKTDELLSEKEKIIIKEKLINILTSIGDESLRAFSAKNYNHVHKIGYLKLIGIVAEKELCYIEDVNSSKNSIKLKIASQFDTLPKLTLNKKIVIPFTAKIKELTIFDINFAYEIYLWFGFKSQHQELSIKNNIKTEIIALGKRFDKLKLETAINSFERKNKITNMLPIKTKLLRYVSTLPFVAKKFEKAWLFIDNEIRADDNAEHFYRYVSKVHPKGKIYFLLNKKSADWKRLKNDGFKLIKFGGFFHRVLLINSQYLLSSHANPAIVNYLPRNHYSDIMKYKFVFLQHGITKDDQSEWLNSRKIDYLVTASTYEYEDISRRGRYRYTTQETVLTGFPRYDNLVKNTISKKQILIMPTWRKDLAGELQKKSSKRVKNPQFSNSIFCEMWGGFLRSDNLKKACFDKGYTVIFYPHPNLVDYIEDLNIPDYIKIGDLSTGSIQTAFKDADLLITDYSSVAFDIAYMKKPIIYFQFDSDTFFASHSYSKGYFDYYKLGFGPVVKDIEMLNTQLLSILDSNCVISPYYEERIDNFFPYNDRDNSSRLYEILSHAITQSYDVNTLLDYLHLFTHQLDINSIIFIFNTFSVELNSIPTNYHERLLGIFEGLDFINIEIECSEFTKEITSLSNSLSIRIAPKEKLKKFNVGDDLSCYSNWIGRKQEKLMRAFQSPENSRLINYINSIKIFLSNYTKHAYSQAVLIYEKELLSYKIPLSSRITKIYIISLVRSDKINAAINIIKKTQLDNIDKHKILMELYDYHAPIHKSALDIECLMPTDNGKKEALEAFLTLSKTIPNDFYLNFNNVNEMPYMVLEYYLNNLYYKKQYADFYSALNRTTNKEHYLDSIENTYRYLTTVFKLLGIDVFIKELFHKYGKENLVKSLDELFIKNNNSDVDVFYKIIEGLISEELFSFSCAELYGYILFFSQKKRRGLAKKLTILAFAKSHQDYYIEDMHWNGKNDYKTLLRAVSEFNEIMLDLERMN